jgi:hypothetical protein
MDVPSLFLPPLVVLFPSPSFQVPCQSRAHCYTMVRSKKQNGVIGDVE